MKFRFTRAMSMIAAMSLAAGLVVACDDDDDKKSEEGYASTCGDKLNMKNWFLTDKTEIINYLNQICKVSEKFKSDDFKNKATEAQGIGAECFCYGPQCEYTGYERPELQTEMVTREDIKGVEHEVQAGKIYGCDGVPEQYEGAIRSCFRSSNVKNIKPAIYFPDGACALTMSKCTPSDQCLDDKKCEAEADPAAFARNANENTICGFAKFGTYTGTYEDAVANFQAKGCPNGQVMVDFIMNISLSTLHRAATLDVRGCFQGCEKDEDCHGYNVEDIIVGEKESKLKCVETNPDENGKMAKICFDKRSVEESSIGVTFVDTTAATTPVNEKYLVK